MSPIEWVAKVGLGVVVGLLLYDVIKALYRQGRNLTIDWDSVGVYAAVTIATVIIFVVIMAATYGFIAIFAK